MRAKIVKFSSWIMKKIHIFMTSLKNYSGKEMVGERTVNNILRQLLVLCGISAPACWTPMVALLVFSKDAPALIIWMLAIIPAATMVITILAYVLWCFINPDRLQSEGHRERWRELDIIEEKGGRVYDAMTIIQTANPSAKSISSEVK